MITEVREKVGATQRQFEMMTEIVGILRDNGIDAMAHAPVGCCGIERFDYKYSDSPMVFLSGDDYEINRAVEIGEKHGFPTTWISQKRRVYSGEVDDKVYWTMEFDRDGYLPEKQ